jgi:hypothetical protein
MATERRNQLSELMRKAWMFVKVYGFTMAEAMKQAWALSKLKKAMKKGIVKFMYTKLSGEIRTAWGTLKEDLIPATNGDNRKKNDSVMVYFDKEKDSYRCFKIANFLRIA